MLVKLHTLLNYVIHEMNVVLSKVILSSGVKPSAVLIISEIMSDVLCNTETNGPKISQFFSVSFPMD